MCQFKSAIYTENGEIFEFPNEDSHQKILKAHGKSDKGIPADFVKIELVPRKNPKDINDWEFIIDMPPTDLPKWWNKGHSAIAEQEFRKLVTEKYLHIDKTIKVVDFTGYFYDCKIGKINGGKQWLYDDSSIKEISGGEQMLYYNSIIKKVCGGTQTLYGNSKINK